MANHVAILTSRDLIVVHENFVKIPETEYYLFEMLNSTNWNSVRLKIPIDDEIGWRVEFRTMEIQLTADENSLFSILMFSIVRLIARNPKLNFYIPLSLCEANFKRAHKMNALLSEKFYFRINCYDDGEPVVRELTLYEIFFGKEEEKFLGIIGLFREASQKGGCCECTIA